MRISAAGTRIVACPHILLHYTQGIGLSANAQRLMHASLFNIDDLERRLGLPAEMAERKRADDLLHVILPA